MKAEFVSTLVHHDTARATIARTQAKLHSAEIEVSTGRHADIGEVLGFGVSRLLDTRQLAAELDAIGSTNAVVAARLTMTQSALSGMVELGQELFESITALRQGGGDRSALVGQAEAALGTLTSLLSTTSNGAYIFSGVNTAVAPVADYLADPPSTARLAVQAAFNTAFGVNPDDPAVSAINGGDMAAYLSGDFSALFTEPGWSTTFSSAAHDLMQDRIAPNETITSSLSANADGIRSLMQALIAAIDSGTRELGAEAFDRLAESILKTAGQAVHDLVQSQSVLGIAQERLAKANARMNVERSLFEERIGAAEGVDSYAAAVRLMSLSTQLEASYSVTSRMQKLSLLNYL